MCRTLRYLLFLIPILFFWQGCGGKIRPFPVSRYEGFPHRIADRFIESSGVENLKTSAFNKVIIVEFNVEYLVGMSDSAYQITTDELYEIFVESLIEKTGWQVIDKNMIIDNHIYKKLKKRKLIRNIIGGNKEKGGLRIISTVYPVSGLGVFPLVRGVNQSNVFSGIETGNREAALLEDLSAAASLKVNTIISYQHKGNKGNVILIPSIKGHFITSKVDIYIGYLKNLSLDGKSYDYSYKNHCSFYLKKPIVSYETFTAKGGTFDPDEFTYWTKEMFRIYSEMLAIEISQKL